MAQTKGVVNSEESHDCEECRDWQRSRSRPTVKKVYMPWTGKERWLCERHDPWRTQEPGQSALGPGGPGEW